MSIMPTRVAPATGVIKCEVELSGAIKPIGSFGSPARLNATAPALAGSRDIPSARLIAVPSLWHSCASPGRDTVFGPDEWESNVIGYGHGGLLSSLHIVSASCSP